MQRYESFGECLRRCLAEAGMSASAAAKCVGFRSRNSIFRILSGDTTSDANLRFLSALHKALGSDWPEERWLALEEALTVERLGPDRYRASQAFRRVLHDAEPAIPEYMVHQVQPDGSRTESALSELLDRIAQAEQAEIVLTGCCDSGLLRLLAERCGKAGAEGRLTIRHYIDTAENVVTQNILECLPLVSMPWYNARLAEPGSCPPEMMAIYRLHSLHIYHRDRDGKSYGQTFIRYDRLNFVFHSWTEGASPTEGLLDRWRFQLELLKPMPRISEGPGVFVDYTVSCAELEDNCAIMAVKQMREYLENGNIVNSVNFPAVDLPRSGKARLCIFHKNVPAILSSISSTVAEDNINIANMINKSKSDFAYTVLDCDSDVSEDNVSDIAALDGIIRVRVL